MMASRSTLGEVAEFINGAAFKPDDWNEAGQPIIRIQNLTDPSKPFNRTTRTVASKYHVDPGDLLVSWSATLGVFEWNRPETGLLNQHIFRVLPDPKKIRKDYLRHMLHDALFEMERHMHGATMKHVNRGEFLATTIPLPPLAEQKRIAGILDAADALRAKRRESIAQLDSLLQSTFDELFVAKGEFSSVSLEEVTNRITDGTHLTPTFLGAGVPFIFVKNIRNGKIDFTTDKFISDQEHECLFRRCPVEPGDVLYTSVGATYGQAALIGNFTKFGFQRHVAHLKPDHSKILPQFLGTVMQLPLVKNQADRWARGAAQPTINLKELREFRIPLPPLPLQRRFATIVESVERQKTRQRAHLSELDALFAVLQHRAFRGEL
ncbi:MAG: hypothetical protein RLZZ214_178 [Verrucomicrobiota bacterium]|jgi:type I restriction enzyme S subunit